MKFALFREWPAQKGIDVPRGGEVRGKLIWIGGPSLFRIANAVPPRPWPAKIGD